MIPNYPKIGVLLSSAVLLCLLATPAAAKQFAIVVGINQYQFGGQSSLSNLGGAKNDALVVARALRKNGIDLPDSRVLIDSDATLANFKTQWHAITSQAKAGDTIIFTFAGHGGQETEVTKPFDEQGEGNDNSDETLMFHDFDPKHPIRGRINDDELFALFEKAAQFNILFVADSCHSGGLVRAMGVDNGLKTRATGTVYEIPEEDFDFDALSIGDEEYTLDNVTMITATNTDRLKVKETRINGNIHGALSWYFAKAIDGAADQNKDGILTRKEMGDFISEKVATHMERQQIPKLLPRSNESTIFSLAANSFDSNPPTEIKPMRKQIRIKFEGITPSAKLRDALVVEDNNYQVLLKASANSVKVYNHTGDHIATLDHNQTAFQKIVDKYQLLEAISQAYNEQTPPVKIQLEQGDGQHIKGAELNFVFEPDDKHYRAFSLFNVAGDGTLQFLYPLLQRDKPVLDRLDLPYKLSFNVGPPYGSDNLIAVFCQDEQYKLNGLLAAHDNSTVPDSTNFLASFSSDNCQLGRYPFFTRNE